MYTRAVHVTKRIRNLDAGLIFDVQPIVMGSSIDLSTEEETSHFEATTSVESSPMKQNRLMHATDGAG